MLFAGLETGVASRGALGSVDGLGGSYPNRCSVITWATVALFGTMRK